MPVAAVNIGCGSGLLKKENLAIMTKKVDLKKPINEDALTFSLVPYNTAATYEKYYSGCCWQSELYGVPNFWRMTRGKGIRIAILDTGIAPNHPALKASVLEAVDFSKTASNAGDGNGHGTHFAGIIAAREIINGQGGIAPHSRLLIGKVLNDNGYGTPRAITNGILWAADCGADIIALNLGNQVDFAPMRAAINYATRKGAFFICTAGDAVYHKANTNLAFYQEKVITVDSSPANSQKYNNNHDYRAQPDIVIRDSQVTSTFPPNGFISMHGSSTATAITAGVAALALSKHRQHGGNTPIETREHLIDHLQYWAALNWTTDVLLLTAPGRIKPMYQNTTYPSSLSMEQ